MKKPIKKRSKIILITISVVLAIFLACFVGLCIYASDYRSLDSEYYYILESEDVFLYDDIAYFSADSDVGIIFYPGGRVDYLAYAPLMQKLQAEGVNVFLVDMPFNMANFGYNKANGIIKDYPEITNWYIGGHSLGGVAANMYATNNSEKINGLIFLGIYLSQEYDLEKTITIYGSNDLRVGDSVTYDTNVYVIEGGNHAQFGNYGENTGDGVATITAEEQQNIATDLIMDFISNLNN